jgi:hypothetical protein
MKLTGRIAYALVALFMIFDVVSHVLNPAPVAEAMTRLGFSGQLSLAIGIVAAICLILFVIPRTSVFGAILLTGYLGGATAIQLRASSPPFETAFPVLFGALVWIGLVLARPSVRALLKDAAS